MTWTTFTNEFAYGVEVPAANINNLHTNFVAVCSASTNAPKFVSAAFETDAVVKSKFATVVTSTGGVDSGFVGILLNDYSFFPALEGDSTVTMTSVKTGDTGAFMLNKASSFDHYIGARGVDA